MQITVYCIDHCICNMRLQARTTCVCKRGQHAPPTRLGGRQHAILHMIDPGCNDKYPTAMSRAWLSVVLGGDERARAELGNAMGEWRAWRWTATPGGRWRAAGGAFARGTAKGQGARWLSASRPGPDKKHEAEVRRLVR
jgi:hypothetical protein